MKKNHIRGATTVLLLTLAASLCCCSGSKPDTPASEELSLVPDKKETTVFIATDLHLYSNNLLSSDNALYVKENFSNDGRIQERDYDLAYALVDEVNAKAPDYLVLTGDLSFNGERDSHLELIRILREIKNTKVLVIPGNHDTYSLNSFSAINDTPSIAESITADDFRALYADFGYSDAYSRDKNSLSYIYKLTDDKWALMLDTTQSKYNSSAGSNITGGFIEGATMTWLEENLKYAKENGISVISFSHHNLAIHNELFRASYTLINHEPVLELLAKYGVNINFSGHLHIQSIKSAPVNDGEIYDISGGSLLDYGNRYGILDIYNNCYSYSSQRLELTLNSEIRKQSFDVFCEKYYSQASTQYSAYLGEELGRAAARLISEMNAYYFDGSYEKIFALKKSNEKLIALIEENTPSYDTSYVKTIIDLPNDDQHELTIKR